MRSYLKTLLLSIFFVAFIVVKSQCQPPLQQLVSKSLTEIYDLYTDSNGFLWIGHSDGVSKFDGISFTNYSHPLQSSLAVTDFAEDKYGRIWFNNFTGQIFYIQNGQMHLLKAYDDQIEPHFPRIGLFGDLLVATTKKGLFVCDVKTLKCHYETCKGLHASGTTSLAIFKNEVVVFGYNRWFFYKPGQALRRAHFNKADSLLLNKHQGQLTTRTFNDTAFISCNPERMVYKIKAINDSLKICDQRQLQYFINSVTVLKNEYWINTARASISVPGNGNINDHDLSCEAIDKQGHYWYGSLKTGLLSELSDGGLANNKILLPVSKGGELTCLASRGNKLIIGTADGKLISYDPSDNTSAVLTQLPTHNTIRHIKMLDGNNAIIGSSDDASVFNFPANKVQRFYPHLVMHEADTVSGSMIFATAIGLMALPYHNSPEEFELWKRRFNAQFKGFNQYEVIDGPYKYLDYVQRTLAVCTPPKSNIIWAALKNGLYKISNLGVRPYYVNNLPVFASSLAVYKNQVIAGTINNGVLIINGNSVKHLSTVDGLLSNNIAGIKITGNELLIYNNGLVQIVDLATFKIADNYRMPGVNDEAIIDAELVNGQLFTADRNSVYKVPVEKKRYDAQISTVGFIVNGRDTDVTKQMTLRYDQNEIGINLGIPSLLNGHDIIIKYRLSTKGAAKWLYSNAGERNFRFYALSAGSYQFEAAAGYLQAGIYGHPIKINFTIMPPWWRTGWAICAMVIAGFLIITAILRLYYRNLLAARKTEFEKKLAIEKERQRISSDMHDDIGASLSAIKLFAGNVKQSPGSDIAIPEIYEMVSDLSDKTREVIWSLSQVYDTLESLIYYIGSTADKLFEHSGIKLRTILPGNIPDCKIDNDKRRDVYLIMKEALNNIIKHANATEALLEFIILNNCLSIKIQDNGIGFPVYPKEKINGQGMINIKNRIKNLGGEIVIERANGTIMNLTIPL